MRRTSGCRTCSASWRVERRAPKRQSVNNSTSWHVHSHVFPEYLRREPSFGNTSDWYTALPRPNYDSQSKASRAEGGRVPRRTQKPIGTGSATTVPPRLVRALRQEDGVRQTTAGSRHRFASMFAKSSTLERGPVPVVSSCRPAPRSASERRERWLHESGVASWQ